MKGKKLTLSVDSTIIEKAKYALSKDESISGLVSDFLETYIAMKTTTHLDKNNFKAHANKFAGIISLQNNINKETISDTIISKHSKRFK